MNDGLVMSEVTPLRLSAKRRDAHDHGHRIIGQGGRVFRSFKVAMPRIFYSSQPLQDGAEDAEGSKLNLLYLLRIEGTLFVSKRPECLGTAIQDDQGEKLGVGHG